MALKAKAEEHFCTVFFLQLRKIISLNRICTFFSLCWLTLLLGLKLSLFCFKSYRFRHVINLLVRLEITIQWSPVA